MPPEKLDIIIVNWNGGTALRACLQSICDADKRSWLLDRVVVVDNASSDESTENLQRVILPLQIIENTNNRGFAVGCNQGAHGSRADYLLFLNPDTRLSPDTLEKSLNFMSKPENSSVGILGVQMHDENGDVSRSCARFFSLKHFFNRMLGLSALFPEAFVDAPMLEWDHLESRPVDHVIGAYFFVRQNLFRELGGFDERFFVYLEDIDFSLRARRNSWTSYFLADAHCFHRGGGSSEQIKPRRLYYSLQSRILYGFKHLGPGGGCLLLGGTIFLEPISRIAQALGRGSFRRVMDTMKGYCMLWRAMPRLLRSVRTK